MRGPSNRDASKQFDCIQLTRASWAGAYTGPMASLGALTFAWTDAEASLPLGPRVGPGLMDVAARPRPRAWLRMGRPRAARAS